MPTLPHVSHTERVKRQPGWQNLSTYVQHRTEQDGSRRIHRLTIVVPQARYLIDTYGNFLLIDATFKLTIYENRITIIISVVDAYGHVHTVSVSDTPTHRHPDWLAAFNHTYDVISKLVRMYVTQT